VRSVSATLGWAQPAGPALARFALEPAPQKVLLRGERVARGSAPWRMPLDRPPPLALEIALTLAVLIGAAGVGTVRGGQYEEFVASHGTIGDLVARKLGFGVNIVTVSGAAHLDEPRILSIAGISSKNSVPFFDVAAARARLEADPLVKQASVRKLYPNQIVVDIVERTPYAVWQKDGDVRAIGADGGPIDEVRFVITNDEATVRSMAASGELTMSSQYQSPDTYDALAKMPRIKIAKGETSVAFYLKLNTKVAPTDDVHIRKAIALATDYDTIHGTILPGGELTGPLPKTFAEAHLDSPQPKFDLEAAKAEIAKSGYAGKTDIPLSLTYVSSAKFEEEIALLMQSNLQHIGFTVTLSGEPWNRVTEIASKVETTPNVTEVFFGPTYPSPDSMFYTQYDSKAVGTWASMEWVQNPEVDKMIDAARATGDAAAQDKIYKDLQKKLIDDQADAFLETQIVRHAMDKCLDGYVPVPMQSFDYAFHRYKWTCS